MAYRTVVQRGDPTIDEAMAGGTIKPGHLVEFYNASGTKKLRVHATAGGNASPIFALEDELQGKDMADSYSSGQQCRVGTFKAADLVAAWIYANETIAIATKLESKGDGTLRAVVADAPSANTAENWVAQAEEALSGNTVDTLCLCRIV